MTLFFSVFFSSLFLTSALWEAFVYHAQANLSVCPSLHPAKLLIKWKAVIQISRPPVRHPPACLHFYQNLSASHCQLTPLICRFDVSAELPTGLSASLAASTVTQRYLSPTVLSFLRAGSDLSRRTDDYINSYNIIIFFYLRHAHGKLLNLPLHQELEPKEIREWQQNFHDATDII